MVAENNTPIVNNDMPTVKLDADVPPVDTEVNTDIKTLFGMSNKTYDILKWIAQILIPVLAVFYSALAGIWHLPYIAEVVGTLSAVDALLGGLLHVSTQQYNKASGIAIPR